MQLALHVRLASGSCLLHLIKGGLVPASNTVAILQHAALYARQGMKPCSSQTDIAPIVSVHGTRYCCPCQPVYLRVGLYMHSMYRLDWGQML